MRGSTDVSPSSSSLIAFKPRQVLLLEQRQRNPAVSRPMAENRAENPIRLMPEDESILNFSVALWLENKGFSKVLKRFLSAAQIQDDDWKARALNLNEIFSKYQEIRKSAHEDLEFQKKPEEKVIDTKKSSGNSNCTESEEKSKKKKKRCKGDAVVTDTGKTPEDTAMSEKLNASYVNGNEDQNHKTSDGISDNVQKSKKSKESNDDEVSELTVDQSTKKQKDKKKKKSKSESESLDGDEKQIDVVIESKQKNISPMSLVAELPEKEAPVDRKSKKRSVEAVEDGVDESKKASKKRKRMAPDENENQPGQEVAVEESKLKKAKGLEEDNNVQPQNVSGGADGHAAKKKKQENYQAGQVGTRQTNESTKGALSHNGLEKSSEPKSARKQGNGSAEPKTVKAFQRVKVEEVDFADERLQDNSYWAKDGAEIGYGAKAQGVLGQVKGRGFRHEKTKKKRGSYRGGQIDLQSHSIKFNYSDDE